MLMETTPERYPNSPHILTDAERRARLVELANAGLRWLDDQEDQLNRVDSELFMGGSIHPEQSVHID